MNKTFEANINPDYDTLNKTIEAFIVKDQTNDLDLYLEESTPLYYSTENERAFVKSPKIPFPELLTTFLRQPALDCKIGSLPSINHAWLITKNSLFLWNFDNKEADLFRYDCSEPIQNVEVVNLPSHKELLVSTVNNVYFHAINENDSKKIKLTSRIATSSYGVVMSNVITTNTGRVFMKGDNGHLYERIIYGDNCSLTCRTMNRLLYYLPSFFKSRPTEAVKSIILDDQAKFLFLLLSDSSICAVNIQGDQYLPYYRYSGKNLESIHLISSGKTKSRLVAISNNGDRFFFTFEEPAITFQYTRPAPPISGSLLFNKLSRESVNTSFYNQGVFANVLNKSDKSYLVFTKADIIANSDGHHELIEDVYHEEVQQKIWLIFDGSDDEFKSALKSPKYVNKPISVITESGITKYSKQTPVEQFEEALYADSPSPRITIIKRYGLLEVTYLAFLSACASQKPQKIDFIRQSDEKEQGLLLYFSRLVSSVWNMNIKQTVVTKDELVSVKSDLKVLINTVYDSQVLIKAEIMELIERSIEAISFICFMREFDWDIITQRLDCPAEFKFADFVTTNHGNLLAQNAAFIAIEISKLSNASNHYSYISNFLKNNCFSLFGQEIVNYLQGIECLTTAQQLKEDKTQALNISLQYLLQVIPSMDLDRIANISQKNCDLRNYNNAIVLAFAKYVSKTATLSDIHDILFSAMKQALVNEDRVNGRQVVVTALGLGSEDDYHFEIYKWLLKNDHKELMITLETSTLVPFIKTQLSTPAESLSCLEAYHTHRKQYRSSISCLYQLATETDSIPLNGRIECLKTASSYLTMANDLDKVTAEAVRKSLVVAEIQLQMYNALNSTEAADQLDQVLLDENELLEQFAYTHSLYEEALLLLDLMDIYNWNYVKEAWNHIVKTCESESAARQKVKELAERIYPSIASFPVYTIYQILNRQFSKETAETILVGAGVPNEVISDAEKTVN